MRRFFTSATKNRDGHKLALKVSGVSFSEYITSEGNRPVLITFVRVLSYSKLLKEKLRSYSTFEIFEESEETRSQSSFELQKT